MAFQTIATYYLIKDLKSYQEGRILKERIIRKSPSDQLNPEIGDPKSHALKGLRSVHVDPIKARD